MRSSLLDTDGFVAHPSDIKRTTTASAPDRKLVKYPAALVLRKAEILANGERFSTGLALLQNRVPTGLGDVWSCLIMRVMAEQRSVLRIGDSLNQTTTTTLKIDAAYLASASLAFHNLLKRACPEKTAEATGSSQLLNELPRGEEFAFTIRS